MHIIKLHNPHGLKSPLARPLVHPQVARCGGMLWQRWQCTQLERLASCCFVFRNAHRAGHSNWRLMHFWHPVAQRCFILFTSLHMHTQGSMLAIIFTCTFVLTLLGLSGYCHSSSFHQVISSFLMDRWKGNDFSTKFEAEA